MSIPGRWMKAPDYFILEYLDEEDLSSPTEISDDGRVPWGRTYINKRLMALEEHGMVVNVGNGMYQLTERGEKWLAGEFDARNFDDRDPGKPTA